MFSFTLPVGVLLAVRAPDGGELVMYHAGDGKFLTRMPPVVLGGISKEPASTLPPAPVEWDSSLMAHGTQLYTTLHPFDAVGAINSMEAAAESGDEEARRELELLKQLEADMAAAAAADGKPELALPPGARGEIILPPGVRPS